MRVGVARERMAAAGPRLREQSWRARALVREVGWRGRDDAATVLGDGDNFGEVIRCEVVVEKPSR